MSRSSWHSQTPVLRWCLSSLLVVCLLGGPTATLLPDAFTSSHVHAQEAEGRVGYLVQVELPLVGDRDEQVRQQIVQIADANSNASNRPVVLLEFRSSPLADLSLEPDSGGMGTRGSQFERCLALARFLTSSDASRVRLVAYLPSSVEGHAVLPVLACEEIVAANDAELGRAAIDEPPDATIEGAYRDVVSRRATLPEAIVLTMLDPRAEAYALELADGSSTVVSRDEAKELREAGNVLSEETLWSGGALATYSGQQLRSRRWIARTVDESTQLPEVLGIEGSLRTVKQLPRNWNPIQVTLSGDLNTTRVNQIIRGIDAEYDSNQINLVVFQVKQTNADFTQAARLAAYIANLDSEDLYTVGLIQEPIRGPIGLVAVACNEAILLSDASFGPNEEINFQRETIGRVLGELSADTGRPLSLLSAMVDPETAVKEYVNQQNGKRAIFAEWQVEAQVDANQWLPKRAVAGGGDIDPQVALKYRLIDSIDDTGSIALSRLALDEPPRELSTPWLDASIQMLLAQSWLPRLLLTIGFFALMVELGNPGLGGGGFLSALCFIGFFWIEGLNGNVEWLEILLFVAGLVALAFELFVVPGFGVFGIGGLLMLFVSVVLASQTFIWPTTSAQLSEVSVNLFWVACLALGGMIGLLFMHKQIERLPMFRWVTLHPDDTEDLDYRESVAHRDHLLGQEGLTTTRLNPSGKAQFGNDIVAVVGTGKLIAEGMPVRVVEVRGNLVLVEEIRGI